MSTKLLIIIISLLWPLLPLYAQLDAAARPDTIPPIVSDSLLELPLDSLPPAASTDSLPPQPDSLTVSLKAITYSKDSLDSPVQYNAQDSMIYDIAGQKIHLYGNASVSYSSINLKAGHIIFDWSSNIVKAEGMPDSLGRPSALPEFSDGSQNFTADSMRYDFVTRKGVVYDVTTQQNDVIVHGERSKFISNAARDTTEKSQDIIFSEGAIFTTCTHDEPHFGIRSRRQKVIPNKLVVVGPSNLEIMGVPTPLWLPFGFFPISSGRRTGLLFPSDYQYSPQWGFGLERIGWFFPLSEHFNLSLTGTAYIKGTWGLQASSQYKKRYKYSGGFDLGFDQRRSEDDEGVVTRPKSYRFTWSHRQERTAHPTNNFGGSINIQTNNYQSRVFNDAQNVLQNQLNSNLAFSKSWRDKPINLNASFSHNQNSATRKVTINFPNVKFQTQALYPFRQKERVGPKRWYEDITMRYQGEARNRFEATDTTLFTQKTLDDAQFGVQQSVSSGTSFKVLKYFNLNPGVNYSEVWYLKSLRKDFIPELNIDTMFNNGVETYDTLSYGMVNDTLIPGFKSYRQFSSSISLNTQIFGTLRFNRGRLLGVRHVIKPSLSFSYTPDYTNPSLGYTKSVQSTTDPEAFNDYSIFQGSIYGGPPQGGRQMALNYSLNNIFEAKFLSKKDSTEKKLKLFDNLVVNGNYNFAADSLNWSPVNVNGTTRLFKGMTTFSAQAQFDPYAAVQVGNSLRRINEFSWRRDGKLLRFVNANARFNTNITVGKIRALFMGEEEKVVEDPLETDNRQPEETDFLSL
ncbi:MAG: LPS-assembly protein LptD, partial [Phaeodactylibacter sp.]|nr:LPS-assembly protein LptD [Phaeodactylibacter sp.]